jgi:hypothetical protein
MSRAPAEERAKGGKENKKWNNIAGPGNDWFVYTWLYNIICFEQATHKNGEP